MSVIQFVDSPKMGRIGSGRGYSSNSAGSVLGPLQLLCSLRKLLPQTGQPVVADHVAHMAGLRRRRTALEAQPRDTDSLGLMVAARLALPVSVREVGPPAVPVPHRTVAGSVLGQRAVRAGMRIRQPISLFGRFHCRVEYLGDRVMRGRVAAIPAQRRAVPHHAVDRQPDELPARQAGRVICPTTCRLPLTLKSA